MATDINLQHHSEESMNNILNEILKHSGASLASFGGGLAVILTYGANLAQWVAIFGGALGLVAGILGIILKFKEIISKNQEIRFKDLQYLEFQKSIERDAQLYEDAKRAGERERIKKEVIHDIKEGK